MIRKKIDLGEYLIKIDYDKETGRLNIGVYDELDEIIESINITNDEDIEDLESDDIGIIDINPN